MTGSATRSSPASIPTRRSSASATTTTSRPRPSSGSRACRSITRATSCTGGCSRARSRRASQLNMLGDPDSCGVWAPCLTHADGLFQLIYTDVKRYGRTTVGGASRRVAPRLPQLPRHLPARSTATGPIRSTSTAAASIRRSSTTTTAASTCSTCCGTTGPGSNRFAGIVLQEYSVAGAEARRRPREHLRGHAARVHRGAASLQARRLLLPVTAEGGTGWGHAVTMARSRNLAGPYELHPDTYVLSARHRPDAALQRAGHADLVETPGRRDLHGLSVRPAAAEPRPLHARAARPRSSRWCGRADGWLRTADGAGTARPSRSRRRTCRAHPFPPARRARGLRRAAAADRLPMAALAVARRTLQPDRAARATCASSAAKRSAACSASRWSRGASRRTASARRRVWSSSPSTSSRWPASSATTTAPSSTTCYVSHDETLGKHLRVMSALPDSGAGRRLHRRRSRFRPGSRVELRVEVDYERLHFALPRRTAATGSWLPQQFDASILSDEATAPGLPELHRRLRRHGLPGHVRRRAARRTSTGSSTWSASIGPTRATVGLVTWR